MPQTPSSGSILLRRAARRRLGLLLPGVITMSLWQVCEALVPVAIGIVVDVAIIPLSLPMLIVSIIGIGLLFTVLSLGYRFGARLCNSAREHEAHALRVEITHAALTFGKLSLRTALPVRCCQSPRRMRTRRHSPSPNWGGESPRCWA